MKIFINTPSCGNFTQAARLIETYIKVTVGFE